MLFNYSRMMVVSHHTSVHRLIEGCPLAVLREDKTLDNQKNPHTANIPASIDRPVYMESKSLAIMVLMTQWHTIVPPCQYMHTHTHTYLYIFLYNNTYPRYSWAPIWSCASLQAFRCQRKRGRNHSL